LAAELSTGLCDRKYSEAFAVIQQIQGKVRHLHPLFEHSYPVTIVRDNFFHVFDIPVGKKEYQSILSEPCPFPMPKGVRAAFPLECYDNRISAVVTEDVFESQEEAVTILHEFVHCAQFDTCELELKESLGIAREYRMKNDFMWEINHPFPYNDPAFMHLFSGYLHALNQQDYEIVLSIKKKISGILSTQDMEYMLWQEWKEGFARYLENKIKNLLGIKENHFGSEQPYTRVSFYESGSLLVSLIGLTKPDVINDLRELYFEIERRS
jgi:hypothetical protein